MASSASTSTSLADELTGRLSHHIDLVAASITSTAAASSPGETEAQGTGEQEEDGHLAGSSQSDSDGTDDAEAEAAASLAALSVSLSRVRHRNHSGHGGGHSGHGGWERAKRLTDEALREQTGIKRRTLPSAIVSSSSSSPSIQVEQLQWILNAHLTASAWGAVLQQLLDEADRVKHEEDYWQSVEGEDSSGLMFLVQTMPVRAANALRVLYQRLHLIAQSPRPPARLFSYTVVKRALPPSLLITSLFPHLSATSRRDGFGASDNASERHSTRSLFFLTFSPLVLARQEVAQKRKHLRELRYSLAERIGGFVKDSDAACAALSQLNDGFDDSNGHIARLGSVMGERVGFLESCLDMDRPPTHTNVESVAMLHSCQPQVPSELLVGVQQTLHKSLLGHSRRTSSSIARLSRPAWLTRSWPWLVATPFVGYYSYRKLYNSRASIKQYYELAKETARGFLVDWVVDPCVKILETLRHGDSQMAIMGRESLKSDFDSLERMVADFAKDQKLPADAIESVARRVREGDMSLVLGAYEQDLKSPLKSAVTGTLVRTLLIQVQKVKVDVDLAMDGIEKMLKSQQLTFAFVGVAPSMVLLYLSSSWLRRIFSAGGPSASSKAFRKRVWYTMRSIDRILTSTLESRATPRVLDNVSTGLLLIELSALREYVSSSAFPTRDRSIKAAFLDDVRELERADTGLEGKMRVFDRLMKSYDKYLKL